MNFEELKKFVCTQMRMSQVYQPLLIRNLVDADGKATIRHMALSLLSYDESQISCYERILKSEPVKILLKHRVITRDRDVISLNVKKLTLKQKAEISQLCQEKLQHYMAKREQNTCGDKFPDDPVPYSLKLKVLRDAGGRCALCGTTKEQSPLHIHYIIPPGRHGKTVYPNLQVLCSRCYLAKSNMDTACFRSLVKPDKQEGCIFCYPGNREITAENAYAFASPDQYAVTNGHTLVIPRRHVADYFDLSEAERESVNELLRISRKQLLEKDINISGFNVGVNCGESAGQSVMHCHVHLIPRRKGDVENPRGGVRAVIPHRMHY